MALYISVTIHCETYLTDDNLKQIGDAPTSFGSDHIRWS